MQKNILITGKPRSGKTTFLSTVIADLQRKTGLITQEMLADGKRFGFEIKTHNGQSAVLAHIDIPTGHKVGRYFVQAKSIGTIIPLISHFEMNDSLYLDEIGEMQLSSPEFKELVLTYLNAENTCLMTISAVYDDEFTKSIKKRDDAILIEIDEANRDEQKAFATQLLKKVEKARRYIAQSERFSRHDSKVILRSEHGTRNLELVDGFWNCSCDFFAEHRVCSHSIATKEITET